MAGWRSSGVFAAGLLALTTLGPVPVATQEPFQFVVSARDADGKPLTDLKTDEVVMTENGKPNQIVKIEPFHLPVKLTIAVDNGILSRDGLAHYRNGLEGLVSTTAPQSTIYQATEIDAALQFLEQR